jgi:abortive infection bacteriophage resistance protein
MKIEKKDINVFLALWIKSDPELWGELRDIQIKLLLQRIVKEMSFAEMAKEHKVDEKQLRLIFNAILKRIEIGLGKEVATHLTRLNNMLERKNVMRIESDFNQIFLN